MRRDTINPTLCYTNSFSIEKHMSHIFDSSFSWDSWTEFEAGILWFQHVGGATSFLFANALYPLIHPAWRRKTQG